MEHLKDVSGMPLSQAEAYLKDMGLQVCVVPYEAKRELEGASDWRVVRWILRQETVELVVCRFKTDF